MIDTSSTVRSHFSSSGEDHLLAVELIHDTSGFDKIRDEWSALTEKTQAHIFQTYEWQRLWWEFFGGNRELHIMLFRHKGALVGVAPFFLDVSRLLGIPLYSRLRLMGCAVADPSARGFTDYSPSDYLDVISLPEFESKVAQALVQYLYDHADFYDQIGMDEIPEDSIILRAFVPRLDGLGWAYKITRAGVCPRLSLPNSVEEFINSLHPKTRRKLSQRRRALIDQGLCSVEAVHSFENLDRTFLEFVELHQRYWNRRGYPGAFCDERYRKFLQEVVRAFLKRGWLWFRTMRSNGKCVAVSCEFRFRDYVYGYIGAFDDTSPLAKYSPSRTLVFLLIEEAIHDGFRVVDFLRGGEEYKFDFTSDQRSNSKISIHSPARQSTLRSPVYTILSFLGYAKRRVRREAFVVQANLRESGLSWFVHSYTQLIYRRFKLILQPLFAKNS